MLPCEKPFGLPEKKNRLGLNDQILKNYFVWLDTSDSIFLNLSNYEHTPGN